MTTIHPILIIPDKLLREKSKDIVRVGDEERQLFDDMHATMLIANGIGLAAPQIGKLKKMVVIDFGSSNRYPAEDVAAANQSIHIIDDGQLSSGALFLANPEIIKRSDETNIYQEGCLSIPKVFEDIERPKKISVRYWDYWGKEKEITADGLLATCLQHEIDHLYGKLIIDYLSPLKRNIIVRKFRKQQQG